MPENYRRTNIASSWTTAAKIVMGYPESYDIDTTGIEITPIGVFNELDLLVTKVNSDPSIFNNRSITNIMVIDDEFMSYSTITKLMNGNYIVNGIIRGIFDTIPANHTAGAPLFFLDFMVTVGDTKICLGNEVSQERLGVTASTKKVDENLNELNTFEYTTRNRSIAPSIMSNLRWSCFRGKDFTQLAYHNTLMALSGDLVFTFYQKNKFQTFTNIIAPKEYLYMGNLIMASASVQGYVRTIQEENIISESKTDLIINNDINEILLFKWADFCRDVGSYVRVENKIIIEIGTYDKSIGIYSYSTYKKELTYRIPTVVGIVINEEEAQKYANNIANIVDLDNVYIPQTSYNPRTVVPYNWCPIILIGEQSSNGIRGQDGQFYSISQVGYRIDGYDRETNKAVIRQIELENNYIFSINFNTFENNTVFYYKNYSGTFNQYSPYTV